MSAELKWGANQTAFMSNGNDDSDAGELIGVQLNSGRSISSWKYLVAHTYANFIFRNSSKECNEHMLKGLAREAEQIFGKWPLHVIQPGHSEGIDYLRVRVTALFTSSPMQAEMHLSKLVVAWFQDQKMRIPDESAQRALAGLEWERLAVDYRE